MSGKERASRGRGVPRLGRYALRAASLAVALGVWQLLTSLDIDLWHRVLHEDQVAVARHSSFRMKLQMATASIAAIHITHQAT